MIPLKDNIPTRTFPVVSVALIIANVIVFLADQATGQTEISRVMTQYGPREVAHFEGGLSAQYAMIPVHVTQNLPVEWYTVFTSMFLHANWLHIGGNMLYLWIFGNNVEDALGKVRFLLFYLACGVAAAAAHIFTAASSTTPTVGASGAIAGLMGAYLILFPQARILSLVPIVFVSTLMEVPAIIVVGLWALLQFFNATMLGGGMMHGGGVAYMAHVGGFVGGIVLIVLLGGRKLGQEKEEPDLPYPYYR